MIEAQSGQDGLDKLETGRPGIILLGLTMPVMDGFSRCLVAFIEGPVQSRARIFFSARDGSIAEGDAGTTSSSRSRLTRRL